jgi:hypothetical protein
LGQEWVGILWRIYIHIHLGGKLQFKLANNQIGFGTIDPFGNWINFEESLLIIVFWAQRADILPATYAEGNDQNGGINRRTDTCLLRLINILMGDIYCEQLISESRANPRWAEIDQKKTGQDSNFWVDVLQSFKDDNFEVGPNIRAGDLQVQDRAGKPLDILKCLSPWATTEYLYKWFNGTQNAITSYRKGFDKRGGRDFELEGIGGITLE